MPKLQAEDSTNLRTIVMVNCVETQAMLWQCCDNSRYICSLQKPPGFRLAIDLTGRRKHSAPGKNTLQSFIESTKHGQTLPACPIDAPD